MNRRGEAFGRDIRVQNEMGSECFALARPSSLSRGIGRSIRMEILAKHEMIPECFAPTLPSKKINDELGDCYGKVI